MSKKSNYEGAPQGVLSSNSIYDRTKYLSSIEPFNYPEFKTSQDGETKPKPTSDRNREFFFDMLFDHGLGTVSHPYFDTFKGFPVDHQGVKLDENNSHAGEIARAMRITKLTDQNYDVLDKCMERWARRYRNNSVKKRMEDRTPMWDDEPRMEEALIKLFNLRDNPLNRQLGKYFWLSFYNRMVNPGCQSPIIVAFIGDQDVGKSYISVLLCQYVLDDDLAAPTSLSLRDIEHNTNDWLRRITGNSVVANIGEMKGFKKTEIETIKEFTTRTVDNLHLKYQNGVDTARQWVTVMDGNSYDGFQRDETGNRRFFPFFVNQWEDKEGQPSWPRKINEDPGSDFKVDFEGFEELFWNIMAECKDWLMEYGQKGYNKFVGECSSAVALHSSKEMKGGRGVIRDELVEAALQGVMMSASYQEVQGSVNSGMFIGNAEITMKWRKFAQGNPNLHAIRRLLTSYGYENKLVQPYGRGYLLRGVNSAFAAKKYFYNQEWITKRDPITILPDSEIEKIIAESMANVDKF